MLNLPFQAVAEIIVSKYFSMKGIRVVSVHICELSLAEATFIRYFFGLFISYTDKYVPLH